MSIVLIGSLIQHTLFGSSCPNLFILSNNQSGATRWVRDYVSHCRDSAFDDYFYHSFIVFEDVQL